MSKYNTIVCKNSQGSWEARTHIPLPFKLEYRGKQFDAELSIVTFRRGSVELSTAASVHRIEDRGIRSHQLCEDFYSVLESDRTITRVTEKVVSGLHAKSVHETNVNAIIRKVADFYKVQWPAPFTPVIKPSDAPPVRNFVFGSEFQPLTYDEMVEGIKAGLTSEDGTSAFTTLRPFISTEQWPSVCGLSTNKLRELATRIKEMPVSYDQDHQEPEEPEDRIISLRYYLGDNEWLISEKDMEGGVEQAYGFSMIEGDTQNAEWGYINIPELLNVGAEFDIYFDPITFGETQMAKENNTYDSVFGYKADEYLGRAVQIREAIKSNEAPFDEKELVLYGVDDFPIYVDACVRDEESNLLFASFYGRDTAIKELMAKLAIESGELSLKSLTLRCLSGKRQGQTVSVYIRDSSSLQKITGRLPKGLFGEMTHLQVFHPSIQANKGAKVAWLLENANPSSITAEHMRKRVWQAVCEMAPIPMFEHWCEPVLESIWDDSVFEMGKKIERDDIGPRFSEPIGNMTAYRVVLRDDFPNRVSKLIRDGVIGLPLS